MYEEDDENYDVVIDINSIMKLDKGWNIKYHETDKRRIQDIKKMIESKDKNFISILGHSNRGKTYILQKISGQDLHPGYEVTTKGISIKIYGQNAILLDTVGTNAPLIVEKGDEDPRDKDDFSKKLNEMNLCQIITNYIVQTFVIHYADILICVVGMLTSSEQQFLNKIKKNCSGKKQLIVIHNLVHFYKKKDIENYVETTLKKSIIHDFEEANIPKFDESKECFNKYYIEKNNGEGHEFDIKHFLMGNDGNEGTNEVRYFNEPTIQFIRDSIDQTVNKKMNILEQLKEHIKSISSQVLEEELTDVQIRDDRIICNEKIKPKEVTADELDNIHFIGKEYEPPFRYYKINGKFTIEIQLCCEIDMNTLKVKQKFNKDSEEFTFIIKGEKSAIEEFDKNNDEEIHELVNKRNWKKFSLEFKVSIKEFEIDGLEDPDENDKNAIVMNYGILYLNYNSE